jgi:luciferase-type oxidoreductase
MSLAKLVQGGFSVGVELPLDNDWSAEGQLKRQLDHRAFGVPDMRVHAELIKQADQLGYRAAWIRDVPLYDPEFGDAAQVFETFSYLGYLAGITTKILLGTAAVVLPLRQPWLVKKAAATIQTLSSQRFLLGVASGDRPAEYPLFGVDFQSRGESFRYAVEILKGQQDHQLKPNQQILPAMSDIPLLVAGLAQQNPVWIGQQMDAWLAYPGTADEHQHRVQLWRQVAKDKPYISFIHLDFVADQNATVQRHRFGLKAGSLGLIRELKAMKAAGVDHIGLHFRRNQQPVADALQQIAAQVLPEFHQS